MPAGRSQRQEISTSGAPNAAATPITSKDNLWLKRFRAALGGEADEPRVVGVEGPHLIEEAFGSGAEIVAVLVSPAGEKHVERLGLALAGKAAARESEVAVLRTTDRLFDSVASTETPQGVAALVRMAEFGFEDLVRGLPLVVMLVGVQDPGNVGTVVRSAEAFGATGVVAAAGTANPLGPKAMRASAGSIFRLPVVVRAQAAVMLAQFRIAGLQLVATTPVAHAAGAGTVVALRQADLRGPVALLVGSEPHGLPEAVVRAADVAVRIAVAPPVESLNAAIAAAVVLYEAARQREALT
jgi:TrmH family RNA methyltransferase